MPVRKRDFTPLERAALDAILSEQISDRVLLAEQLRRAFVISRKNTGGGFYSDLMTESETVLADSVTGGFGHDVWISIDGLELGLGMILHLKDGRVSHLEGYAVGPEDTSSIDFESVSFAIAEKPGAFSAKRG